MAASSPYSGNDYQAISNFRPYDLPINDIFRAITAQDEFWKAGARRVKAVYENALSLDLTLDANKEVKRKFMDEADKQLTKLSSMDLTDPSVQRQGFNIYKPLFQDDAIMLDNQLTKTLKGIYADANSYRKKKLSSTGAEGEGYTDRNLAYSLDGFENFNSETPRDPELLKQMHQKLGNRKFTPYYNPTQEYASILKNCKGSGGEKQDVASNYMYFDLFSKTGANSSETSNCFMMGLSEKAKEQMGIDGWAYYRNNPQLLANDHRQFALGRHEAQLEGVKGKIEGIKAGGITAQEKPALKELEDMLPALQKEYDTRVKEYDNMVGGNALNYVTQNFQTLSKGIYLSKNYAALGEAFKSDEVSRKLTANAAGIAQFNAIERSHLADKEHEYNMEEITLRATLARKLKQDAGELPLDQVVPLTPPVTGGTDTGQDYGVNDFNREKDLAYQAFNNAHQSVISYVKSRYPNDTKGKVVGQEFVLNFANEQGKKPPEQQDKQFIELMATYNQTMETYRNMNMRAKAINTTVENELGLRNKTYNIGGVNLTWDELAQVRSGREVKGVRYNPERVTSNSSAPGMAMSYSPGFYSVGNKIISKDPYSEQITKSKQRQDELHRKAFYDAKGYVSPRINPEKMPGIENMIKNVLGVIGGNNAKNGYRIYGHDKTGRDLIVIPLDEDGNPMKPDLVAARDYGQGITKENIGKTIKAIRIPNVLPALPDVPTAPQQDAISNLRNFQTLMETQLRNKGSYFSSESLKNPDGTTYPYTTYSFQTPRGTNIRVKAVYSNGQTKLVPSVQLKSGGWDDNYQSFATPEELVLYFRTQ